MIETNQLGTYTNYDDDCIYKQKVKKYLRYFSAFTQLVRDKNNTASFFHIS